MKMLRRLWWITIGAAVAWFLDPDHGRERREAAKQKFKGMSGGADPAPTRPVSMTDETRDPLHEAV